jgi:hypothetical protein
MALSTILATSHTNGKSQYKFKMVSFTMDNGMDKNAKVEVNKSGEMDPSIREFSSTIWPMEKVG